jgi:dynein heavy chain 2
MKLMVDFLGVKTNLHIVLVMDFTRPTFTIACQSNPGFFKECAVQWMEGWSERSMLKVNIILTCFYRI